MGKKKVGVRVTIDLSPKLNKVIEGIADETDTTKSNVFRKALALMEIASDARRRGLHFGVTSNPDNLDREVIGI